MREYVVVMEVAMVIGLIILMSTQIVPSSAQQDLPGECWKKIGACRKNAMTAQEFDVECCPIFIDELNNNTTCFCSLKPILEQDPSLAEGVSQLLNICKIGATFNVICSGTYVLTSTIIIFHLYHNKYVNCSENNVLQLIIKKKNRC